MPLESFGAHCVTSFTLTDTMTAKTTDTFQHLQQNTTIFIARAIELNIPTVPTIRYNYLFIHHILACLFPSDGQKVEQMQSSMIKKTVKSPAAQAQEAVVHLSG